MALDAIPIVVSAVIVEFTIDDGPVGWGEAGMNADAATTLAAVEAARIAAHERWRRDGDFHPYGEQP